jgi:hypothetical protein
MKAISAPSRNTDRTITLQSLAAVAAIVLYCGLGTATIVAWRPSSMIHPYPSHVTAAGAAHAVARHADASDD